MKVTRGLLLLKEKEVDWQDAVIMRKEQPTPIDPDKCVSGRADRVLDDIVTRARKRAG